MFITPLGGTRQPITAGTRGTYDRSRLRRKIERRSLRQRGNAALSHSNERWPKPARTRTLHRPNGTQPPEPPTHTRHAQKRNLPPHTNHAGAPTTTQRHRHQTRHAVPTNNHPHHTDTKRDMRSQFRAGMEYVTRPGYRVTKYATPDSTSRPRGQVSEKGIPGNRLAEGPPHQFRRTVAASRSSRL